MHELKDDIYKTACNYKKCHHVKETGDATDLEHAKDEKRGEAHKRGQIPRFETYKIEDLEKVMDKALNQ